MECSRPLYDMEYTIHEFVKKIIGSISSEGCAEIDEERYKALALQCDLITELVIEVIEESKRKERHEGSMQKSGKFAYEYLMFLKRYLDKEV